MSTARYLPGNDWLGVVRAGVVILLPATTDRTVLDRLWDQLGEDPDLQSILPVVTGGLGRSLSALPSFGVVSYVNRLHVLLRGPVRVGALDDGKPVVLSGEHVTTWTERIIEGGAEGFRLWVGADSWAPEAEAQLPLESGIVPASALSIGPFVRGVAAEPASADVPQSAIPAAEPASLTGHLDAEASATINPGLFLTSAEDDDDDDGRADGADAAGDELPVLSVVEAPDDPELNTTGYDHLWDQTVVRQVEDAAVRAIDEDEQSGTAEGVPGTPASPQGNDDASEPSAAAPPTAVPATAVPATAASPTAPITAAPIEPAAPGQLIDSVPWARKSETPSPSPSPSPTPVAARMPSAPAIPSVPEDHDGQTIMRSDLPGRGGSLPHDPEAAGIRPATGPLVLARVCPRGHANPPEAAACSNCALTLDGDPQEVHRPSLGTMRISTGEVVELEQSLIIGRQPSVSRVQGSGMPKLVQVNSAGGDISRSHVEVRLEGWHVLLCDLKATNGTVLLRSGQPPRRLGEGEAAFLLDGDVAQLGDDIFLRFEGLR